MASNVQAGVIGVNPLPNPTVGSVNVQFFPGFPPFLPDTVIVDKDYDSLGELGFEILVNGPTPLIDITETITNNTGVDWTDFHWELTAANAFFLDAVFPFPNIAVNPTTVWADGAVVPDGVQLPGQLFVDASAVPVGVVETITITQHPTTGAVVPEPSTFTLLLLGGVTLCGIGWRRRKPATSVFSDSSSDCQEIRLLSPPTSSTDPQE